uniref:AAA family protein n=1 Tax=Mycena chlorophos TaxID=658473 RepID=A0ABQ0M7Z5_MYCCL|nr:AAA family protein [Mycena chlorophos]
MKRKADTAKQKTLFDHFKKVSPPEVPDEQPPVPPPPAVIDLTLDSSPAPPARTHRTEIAAPKPTYSIFQPRAKLTNNAVESTTSSSTSSIPSIPTPFPSNETQHVQGPQTTFTTSSFPSRLARREGPVAFHEAWSYRVDSDAPETSRYLKRERASENTNALFEEHKQHPAIAAVAAIDSTSSPDALWTDHWRPKRADDVLGNAENAGYLRDWLNALEIRFETGSRGAKRTVKRSVARPAKRRRRSEDEFEWIVSDASDYSEPEVFDGGRDDDDFEPGNRSLPAFSPFDKHLSNTILLHGPSGCGKTAAVYACAEELDWEVFEVHPGVGKRNGASLETLVGDVGKNHLVRRTGRKKEDQGTDFGFVVPRQESGARQSLILLEEVDILYRDDANFWPAVVKLIKDCKRPVICTCNDISLVPVDDLPLQTTLHFGPCSADEAGPYLEALSYAAGYAVERDALVELYCENLDLRRSIHHLQVGLASRPDHGEGDCFIEWTTVSKREDLKYADTLSYMDAYLTRNGKATIFGTSEWVASANDELGHPVVADADEDSFGLYEADRTIVAAVTRQTHARRPRVGSEYVRLIDKLKEHRALAVGVMQRSEAHTEYIPWLRQIVVAEDELETQWQQKGRRGTRSRRYERNIDVEDELRELLLA